MEYMFLNNTVIVRYLLELAHNSFHLSTYKKKINSKYYIVPMMNKKFTFVQLMIGLYYKADAFLYNQ